MLCLNVPTIALSQCNFIKAIFTQIISNTDQFFKEKFRWKTWLIFVPYIKQPVASAIVKQVAVNFTEHQKQIL